MNNSLERHAVCWASTIINFIQEREAIGKVFISWLSLANSLDGGMVNNLIGRGIHMKVMGYFARFSCRYLMRPIVGRRALALLDFLSTLPVYSALINSEGYVLHTNEAWKALSDRTLYSTLGLVADLNFFVRMPSLELGTRQVTMRRRSEHHQQVKVDDQHGTHWLQLSVTPLGTKSEDSISLVQFRDITHKKAVSLALSEHDKKLHNTNVECRTCTLTLCQDGIIDKIDDAGVRLINETSNQNVIGMSWFQFLPASDHEAFTSAIRAITNTGEARVLRHRICPPGAPPRWLETIIRLTGKGDNGKLRLLAESSDLTSWRDAETQLLGSQKLFENFLHHAEIEQQNPKAHRKAASALICKDLNSTTVVRLTLLDASPSCTFNHSYWKRHFHYLQSSASSSITHQIDALEKAIASDDSHIDQFYNLAFLYWNNGELSKARWAWEKMRQIREKWWRKECPEFPGVRLLAHHWISNIGHYLLTAAYIKLSKLGLVEATDFYLHIGKETPIGNSYLTNLFGQHIHYIDPDNHTNKIPKHIPWLFAEDNFYLLPKGYRCGLHIVEATTLALKKWKQAGLPENIIAPPPTTSAFEGGNAAQGIRPQGGVGGLLGRAPGFAGASVRDARIEDYTDALKLIIRKGGKIVRVGDSSMPPAPRLDGLIDYALEVKKDSSIDVLLCAYCRFFIGGPSGPGYVPPLFEKPCLYLNWAPPLVRPVNEDGWYLPKLYYQNEAAHPMHLKAIISSSLGGVETPEALNRAGISVIDNTPEQICEAVQAFYRHQVENEPVSDEDAAIQAHFEEVSNQAGAIGSGKVVPSFVRQNPTVSGWHSKKIETTSR